MSAVIESGTTAAVCEQARLAGQLGWLALVLTPGMGATRSAKAVQRLGAAERVLTASLTELEATGMPAKSAQYIADGRALRAAEDEIKRVADAGGSVLTQGDEAYPERLREIYDPPAVLWIRGNVTLLSRPGIAVVGRGSPRRTARVWRRCCRETWRIGD